MSNPLQGKLVDKSGTIASGTTSQTLAAINTARSYLLVVNLDPNEILWINFTSDAAIGTAGSIPIAGYGSFVMEASMCSTEKVTVNATTTGHKYTAKES